MRGSGSPASIISTRINSTLEQQQQQQQQQQQNVFFNKTAHCNYYSSSAFQNAPSSANHHKNSPNSPPKLIRLSKRMSELDICSRREADRFIMAGRVMLNGIPVEPVLGQKVSPGEENIMLVSSGSSIHQVSSTAKGRHGTYQQDGTDADIQRRPLEFPWEEFQTSAVVLHKPVGYVSGIFHESSSSPQEYQKPSRQERRLAEQNISSDQQQEQSSQQHIPAVRLLTPDNAHIVPSNYYDFQQRCVNEAEYQEANNIVDHRLNFELYRASNLTTLQHYVPAGRLDLDSTGLLIFTSKHSGGVLAKKLISPDGLMEKEYLLVVEPLQGLTRRERDAGMLRSHLPSKPSRNLSKLKQGGYVLQGEEHRPPLRPVVAAEWLRWDGGNSANKGRDSHKKNKDHLVQTYLSPEDDLLPNERRRVLRIVLKEGRKHQLRRMCREMLGLHVVKLVRTRIGPIELDSLEEGKWRPLRASEAEAIYSAS